jgi:hypothetical protein
MRARSIVPALVLALGLCACGDRDPGPLPPERVETVPPPPGEAYVWERGHWARRGGEYVWVPGRYLARPYARSVWVPGHYRRTRWGEEYVPGHWR